MSDALEVFRTGADPDTKTNEDFIQEILDALDLELDDDDLQQRDNRIRGLNWNGWRQLADAVTAACTETEADS